MRTLFLVGICSLSLVGSLSGQDTYQYYIDLTKASDDKIFVELTAPALQDSVVEFQIPKIVPGTYSISDFGRFVSEFTAYDAADSVLEVAQVGTNRWEISGAESLARVSYYLDDTYDTDLDNVIFEPSGTNFEEGQNFVINTHGVFGYFKGYDQQPFEVSFTRPKDFFGATALEKVKTEGNTDTFKAPRYFELADAPIMYCVPDTATMNVGGAEVLVSVYSPGDKVSASFVKDQVSEILNAQKAYLGGTLPVDRYAFIIYLFSGNSLSGAYGALEHSYSSMYFLPEYGEDVIAGAVRDIASHEFFHVVTPLNIHSEEIGNFDFINPQMSQHLWLYEGVTEYSAHHAQVSYGITSLEDFVDAFHDKITSSRDEYDDALPFTEMSKGVLEEYEDEYGNVYQKGALIGFCLDIALRQWSNGDYGLQDLIADLSKTYGKEVSFKDDELFETIASLTDPSIKEFLTTYVSGTEPLPLEEAFGAVGVEFLDELETERVMMNVAMNYNAETERIFVQDVSQISEFAQDMGLQMGDEIVSIKGNDLTIQNYAQVFEDLATTEARKKVRMVVARKQEDGSYKLVKLKARAITTTVVAYNIMRPASNPTEDQMAMRNAWLGK